jgi:hypothetical protein
MTKEKPTREQGGGAGDNPGVVTPVKKVKKGITLKVVTIIIIMGIIIAILCNLL